MSHTERIERIRADEVSVGDRVKMPGGDGFYELTHIDLRPTVIELASGWAVATFAPEEIVERENWQVGDAAAEVEQAKRDRLDDLAALVKLATLPDDAALEEWSNDELLAYEIGYGEAGPLSLDTVREQAEERLNEYPLCVEATTVFEVVIGTGGPDDRFLFECSGDTESGFEIDRVLYRYSWSSSAERVLGGDERETAEELARRAVPELVDA